MAEKYLDKAGVQKLWAKTKDLVSQKVNTIDVYTKGEIDTKLSGKANSVHSHSISDITDLKKGQANGVASLGNDGRVPSSQLPSYVDDVLEFTNRTAFPQTGEDGKIYLAKDTNKIYRWGGSAYVEITSSIALGETSSTAYAGDKGKKNADDIAKLKTDLEGKAPVNHNHDDTYVRLVSTRNAGPYSNYHYRFNFNEQSTPLTIYGEGSTNAYHSTSGQIILGNDQDYPIIFFAKDDVTSSSLNDYGTKVRIGKSSYDSFQISRYVENQSATWYTILDESMALTEEELNEILV